MSTSAKNITEKITVKITDPVVQITVLAAGGVGIGCLGLQGCPLCGALGKDLDIECTACIHGKESTVRIIVNGIEEEASTKMRRVFDDQKWSPKQIATAICALLYANSRHRIAVARGALRAIHKLPRATAHNVHRLVAAAAAADFSDAEYSKYADLLATPPPPPPPTAAPVRSAPNGIAVHGPNSVFARWFAATRA